MNLSKKDSFSSTEQHLALSKFVIYTLVIMSVYSFAAEVLAHVLLNPVGRSLYTPMLLTLFIIPIVAYIIKTEIPSALLGFNWGNLKKDIPETLIWSFLFCVLLLLVKWWLLEETSIVSYKHLFYLDNPRHMNPKGWAITPSIYIIFAFIQTVISQGAIQSSLTHLTKVRNAELVAIIVSTLIFSSLHMDLHFFFAIATIPACLLWAILYARQRSLLGPFISHAIIGVWAFWFLGFDSIFTDLHKYFHWYSNL